jgi:hypothetical protein
MRRQFGPAQPRPLSDGRPQQDFRQGRIREKRLGQRVVSAKRVRNVQDIQLTGAERGDTAMIRALLWRLRSSRIVSSHSMSSIVTSTMTTSGPHRS